VFGIGFAVLAAAWSVRRGARLLRAPSG